MGGFLSELRRRHIFRIAGVYVVAAWGVAQVIDLLSQTFALPDWLAQPLLLVLALGFPFTLIAAWMIVGAAKAADTPAELRRATTTDWVLAGALIAVLAFMGYQQITPTPQMTAGVEAAREAAASLDNVVSLAVLPFANVSGDPEQEAFSDGITDEIGSALARVPDLRVVARRSAYAFKNQNTNMATIANALGATHLIDGSVRMAGDRVRITAQLVHAEDGLQMWSDDYDRQLTDVFAVQEEIATAIASALNMQLGLAPGESLISSRTNDPAVYEDFLRARSLYQARSLNETISILESVVERDPNYAPAWALLAFAYRFVANRDPIMNDGTVDEVRELISAAHEKSTVAVINAERLDASHPAVLAARAFMEGQNGRYGSAEEYYRRSLDLDPSNPDVLDRFRTELSFLGKTQEAVRLGEQLLILEPSIPIYRIGHAAVRLNAGPDEVAMQMLETTDTDDERFHIVRTTTLALTYAQLGRFDDAADILLSMRNNLLSRDSVEAAANILRVAPTEVEDPSTLPRLGADLNFVYAFVGASERIMEWYEERIEIQGFLRFVEWSPAFSELRQTERFKNYIRNAGIYDYWRENGFADICRPVGTDDFECD